MTDFEKLVTLTPIFLGLVYGGVRILEERLIPCDHSPA
jgi:hypothetical protein